jgi:hypothetical protein
MLGTGGIVAGRLACRSGHESTLRLIIAFTFAPGRGTGDGAGLSPS